MYFYLFGALGTFSQLATRHSKIALTPLLICLAGAGEGDIPYSHRHPIGATLTLSQIFSDEDTNNIGL
jgi:hypothetical protein